MSEQLNFAARCLIICRQNLGLLINSFKYLLVCARELIVCAASLSVLAVLLLASKLIVVTCISFGRSIKGNGSVGCISSGRSIEGNSSIGSPWTYDKNC